MIKILDIALISYFYFYLGLFVTGFSFIPLILHKLPFSQISNVTWSTVIFTYHKSNITMVLVRQKENIPVLIKVFASGVLINAKPIDIK